MKTERKVARFIERDLFDGEVGDGDPLANGMLDSLALEALIAWVEEELAVPLEDEDLDAENFASIPALSAFLDKKRSASVAVRADA